MARSDGRRRSAYLTKLCDTARSRTESLQTNCPVCPLPSSRQSRHSMRRSPLEGREARRSLASADQGALLLAKLAT
eukprot:1351186-Prymnesium_polylepis.1